MLGVMHSKLGGMEAVGGVVEREWLGGGWGVGGGGGGGS